MGKLNLNNRKLLADANLATRARWVFIFCMVLIGVLTKVSGIANVNFKPGLMVLLLVLASAYNLFPVLWKKVRKKDPADKLSQTLIFLQFLCDIAIITTVIHFAGGVESISFIFYFFIIISASFVYGNLGVFLIALLSSLAYSILIYAEYAEIFSHIPRYSFSSEMLRPGPDVFLINAVTVSLSLITIGFFSGYLSQLKSKKEKEALDERNRRIAELKAAEKNKSQFITILSHQFRTPLTHIKLALAELLENKEKFGTEDIKWLEEGERAAENLISILRHLFEMIDFEEKRAVVKKETICLNELLEKSIENIKFLTAAKNLTVVSNFAGMPKFYISGDKSMVLFVMEAFLQNAIDYSNLGTEIKVYLSADSGLAKIAVSNRGIGISPEENEMIFKKFFRSKEAFLTATDRSGLSLYLAKMVMEKHGGRIGLKSKPGEETLFFAEFPIVRPGDKIPGLSP
jgi:signal transduction histidine kinase